MKLAELAALSNKSTENKTEFVPTDNSKMTKSKRSVNKVDLSQLKEGQRKAFEKLLYFVDTQESSSLFTLQGFAGTGKTYLMSVFIEYLLNRNTKSSYKNIAMTAPTNKAVRVLFNMCQYKDEHLVHCTLHSLFGIKPVINDEGEQIFVEDTNRENNAEHIDILIIDECSQLSNFLFKKAYNEARFNNLKVIFVGDPLQIPPVNQNLSLPVITKQDSTENEGCIEKLIALNDFDTEHKVTFYFYTLVDIIRQALDNPIIALATKLRERIKAPIPIPVKDKKTIEGKGYAFISKDQSVPIVHKFFLSPDYDGRNYAKIIGWTNDVVNKYNKAVRRLLYPDHYLDKLIVGEFMTATRPVMDEEGTIVYPNNEEFLIQSFEVKEREIRGVVIKYYEVVVIAADLKNSIETILVLHENSEKDFQKILNQVANYAKRLKAEQQYIKSREMWRMFWDFKNLFAGINYNYAITAHRAQGSTYKNSIILWNNIEKNNKVFERNRIKYTALTRSSDYSFLVL